MTVLPARRLQAACDAFKTKGRLQLGCDADLCVLDLDAVADAATFTDPAAPSRGVRYLLVKGTVVVDDGRLDDSVSPGDACKGSYTMAALPPALVGFGETYGGLIGALEGDGVETPALVLDTGAFASNVAAMGESMRLHHRLWRPHVKAVRSPALAKVFLAAGAVGVTCAKVSQAKLMADQGVRNILIANEIVGPQKVAALAALAKRATVCVAVDDAGNLEAIAAACAWADTTVDVLVDIDVGMGRCGVSSDDGDAILALCELADKSPGVRFRGLMGYDGHAQNGTHADVLETKRVAHKLQACRALVEGHGLAVDIVSGAGSRNYVLAATLDGANEIQAGGGCFQCVTYETAMAVMRPPKPFQRCLFLVVQVVSVAKQNSHGRVVCDAGFKTQPGRGFPRCLSHPRVRVVALNAEHAHLDVSAMPPGDELALGEKLLLQPFYSDATTFCHRTLRGYARGDAPGTWVKDVDFDLSDAMGVFT